MIPIKVLWIPFKNSNPSPHSAPPSLFVQLSPLSNNTRPTTNDQRPTTTADLASRPAIDLDQLTPNNQPTFPTIESMHRPNWNDDARSISNFNWIKPRPPQSNHQLTTASFDDLRQVEFRMAADASIRFLFLIDWIWTAERVENRRGRSPRF